ncbi:MAG TPA: hypothetical protein VJY99_10115 [Buttiauxella sp.]|nr:hypothetical protein [Buttiauxella sp.]HKM97035.1 hypothetical protein [Buttiauxella sp.]
MKTYRKDADVGVQHAVIAQLAYALPEIAPFDSKAGVKAVGDAIRKQR